MFKGKTTTYIVISLFLLIIAISAASFFVFQTFENQKEIVKEQKQLLIRNNYLIKDIFLNLERLEEHENDAKDNIKSAALLYRLSFSVFKNGGIVPELENEIVLPQAEKEYIQDLKLTSDYMESFSAKTELIPENPVFIYQSVSRPVLVNGKIITKKEIVQKKNQQLKKAIKSLMPLMHKLENINAAMIKTADEKIRKKLNSQIFSFIVAFFLIITSISLILLFFKKKVVDELNMLYNENLNINTSFNKKQQVDYSKFYFNSLFETTQNFKQLLLDLSVFTDNLYQNNFNTKPGEQLSQTSLNSGLIALRDNLKKREKEEKARRIHEKRRQWAVEGRNKISNILQSTGTISELTDKVIIGLAKYLGAAQGGIFLLKQDDEAGKYLEMASAFAYDRKKYLTKKIPLGDGLLGMAALEETTYWLKSIPKDYIEIESGLGEAAPKSLLIVPLKAENEMPGVLEIAAFNKFEQHEVDFIEEIAQNIGSSLRSVKIAEQTAKLLEESRKKSEELASQDSQMRERFQELRDAQRKAKKNEMEMSALISVIDTSLLKCEISDKGYIISANRRFFTLTDFHSDELLNRYFGMLLDEKEQKLFSENLKKVLKGETIQFSTEVKTKFEKEAWVLMQMAPVRNEEGKITEALLIGNDITHQQRIEEKNKQLLKETIEKANKLSEQDKDMQTNIKVLLKTQEQLIKKEFELNALLGAIDTNYIIIEFTQDKIILNANERFKFIFKGEEIDLTNVTINDIICEKNKLELDKNWENIVNGSNYDATLEFNDFEEKPVWLIFSLSPVRDQAGNVNKVVMIASDITSQKAAEEKIAVQAKEMEQQEEFMKLNMQEMTETNELLQNTLNSIKEKEKLKIEKKANKNDLKYFEWIDELF